MRFKIIIALAIVGLFSYRESSSRKCDTKFPNYNEDFKPQKDKKDLFELSQDYPDTFNVKEIYPWTKIDFKTNYKAYMKTVLDYCLEGNTEVDFKVQNNSIRKWYNAPWLHYGMNGREFYHGLTRERPVPAHELHRDQDVWLENWAIGFYNAPGGYTVGRVWCRQDKPDLSLADFPDGTVSFKLLFTAGTLAKVPFLKGTKEWQANIYPCNPETGTPKERAACRMKRIDSTVRLLQIDIAIKDPRAAETGWVFGTFIFDGAHEGQSVWDKMIPVGIMWGDDAKVDTMINREGAFINQYLMQTVLNMDLIETPGVNYDSSASMSHHGLGGRLNGPVDNPISSCISCHSKAAVTDYGSPAPLGDFKLTRSTFTKNSFLKYFSTIKGGAGKITIDTTVYNKLDYSLQLSSGIRNFYQSIIDKAKSKTISPAIRVESFAPAGPKDLPEVTRDGLKKKE